MRRKLVPNGHVLSGTEVEVDRVWKREGDGGGYTACRERLACHQWTVPLDILSASSNMAIANTEI